jgi:O-methyltransferase involved in polyketide biosynthesis
MARLPDGISRTALIVARARARETMRPDRLFADRLAARFVAAARTWRADDPLVDVDDLLTAAGWRTRFHGVAALAACYGRSVPAAFASADPSASGVVNAERPVDAPAGVP